MVRSPLGVQLHDVRHLVPAEADEAGVVLDDVALHHDVRLEVRLPLNPAKDPNFN